MFQPFNSFDKLDVHKRHLPHWEQPGATYFLTFRLSDALPLSKRLRWQNERDAWLRVNGLRSMAALPGASLRLRVEFRNRFARPIQEWLDRGHGSCVLRKPEVAGELDRELRLGDGSRYVLDEFVIMPNHVHLLVMPLGQEKLSSITQAWKGRGAFLINRRLARTGKLWATESYDHLVRDVAQLTHCRDYIRANPGKAGLVGGGFTLGSGTGIQVGPQFP